MNAAYQTRLLHRFLSVLTILALGTLLAGCSKSNDKPNRNGDSAGVIDKNPRNNPDSATRVRVDPVLLLKNFPHSLSKIADNHHFMFTGASPYTKVKGEPTDNYISDLIDRIIDRFIATGDPVCLGAMRSICEISDGEIGDDLSGAIWKMCWNRPKQVAEFMYANRETKDDAFEDVMIQSISDHVQDEEHRKVTGDRIDGIFSAASGLNPEQQAYLNQFKKKVVDYSAQEE